MWVLNGHVNSSFFHASAHLNKYKNSVFQVIDQQGSIQTNKEGIKQAFINFYSSLWFEQNATVFSYLVMSLPFDLPSISREDSEILVKNVSKGEIYRTLMSIAPGESLGPDGFNDEFFKFFWNNI